MVIRSYVSSTALAACTMLGLSVTGVNSMEEDTE